MIEKVVAIKAVDWTIADYQMDIADALPLMLGNIVGYFISEDEERLTLAQQIFLAEKQMRAVISIPKANIKWRQDFELVDASESGE